MKSYIINTDTLEYPIYEGEYRLKYPDTSFPQDFEPEAPYAWVYETDPPEVYNFEEAYKEVQPRFIDTAWLRIWEVYQLDVEALAAKEASIAARQKQRATKLLLETDWTQVGDVNLQNKQEFIDYRVALRMIALNPPNRPVDFPTKPTEIW